MSKETHLITRIRYVVGFNILMSRFAGIEGLMMTMMPGSSEILGELIDILEEYDGREKFEMNEMLGWGFEGLRYRINLHLERGTLSPAERRGGLQGMRGLYESHKDEPGFPHEQALSCIEALEQEITDTPEADIDVFTDFLNDYLNDSEI